VIFTAFRRFVYEMSYVLHVSFVHLQYRARNNGKTSSVHNLMSVECQDISSLTKSVVDSLWL
jgi:hypothetical protein